MLEDIEDLKKEIEQLNDALEIKELDIEHRLQEAFIAGGGTFREWLNYRIEIGIN